MVLLYIIYRIYATLLYINYRIMYNQHMSYKKFKENLVSAGISNTELAEALGMESRQAITFYNAQGRKVPVCMMLLSEKIAELSAKGINKAEILHCGKSIDYDDLKSSIKQAGLNNKLFSELIGYDAKTISNYKRQQVPRCIGMLARLLVLKSQLL